MKKVAAVAIAVVSAFSVVLGGVGVSAQAVCPSGYTGPNSNNVCVSVTTYACTVINNTTVTIDNNNEQLALTGASTTSDNTTGGTTTTGSATNANGTTFDVVVTNPGEGQGTCVATSTVAPTETTPPAKETVPAPKQAVPAVLPNTSGNQTLSVVTTALVVLGAAAVAVRLATLAYGRIKG